MLQCAWCQRNGLLYLNRPVWSQRTCSLREGYVEVSFAGTEIDAGQPDGKHEFLVGRDGDLKVGGIIVVADGDLGVDDVIEEGV